MMRYEFPWKRGQNQKFPFPIKGQDFAWEEKEAARKNGRLLMISPCVNRKCNLHCPFCYADSGLNAEGNNQLMLEEYERVILEAKELGAKTVHIAGWEEPFCAKISYDPKTKSFPLIDYANSLEIRAVFFTDGTLITKEIAEKLIHKDVSVIAKCNSFQKEARLNVW